ncbi:MAG: radical SAM protein [Bacteroidales bacterium]|nr:radical SAM protein [Bacteroidales bacterium]
MIKISKYLYKIEFENQILLYQPISDQMFKMKRGEYDVFSSKLKNINLFKNDYPTFYNWLTENLFLVSNDVTELNIIRTMNKVKCFSDKDYWLTINPTLECNLNCWYCSVKEATGGKIFEGKVNSSVYLSLEKHIQYMITQKKITGLHIDWFGGEPLLYFKEVILPLSKYAIDVTSKYKIPLTCHITTNGTLISKSMARQFKQLNINSFQISIDGNKSAHDKVKYFKNNKNSAYDTTIKNIILILEANINAVVDVRINFDKDTLSDIDSVLNAFPIGLRKQINIDFHKIFQLTKIKDVDINIFVEKAKTLGYSSSYWAFRPQRFYTCYADKYFHAAINFDGKVFKCTARDYTEKFQIGTLLENGKIEYIGFKQFEMHALASFENEQCLKCKYLPLCFGPCIQFAFDKNNNDCNRDICAKNNWEMTVNDFIISKYKESLKINDSEK